MSVILREHAKNVVHPMPFELHYSPAHKGMYEADRGYICGGTTDRDLAAHLTVVKHRGVCLHGKPIDEVFGSIQKSYFIDALIYDIEDAKEKVVKDPVNVTLNLCRTLYFLRRGFIGSKLEGGYWCESHLPAEHQGLVAEAVKVYTDSIVSMQAGDAAYFFAGTCWTRCIRRCLSGGLSGEQLNVTHRLRREWRFAFQAFLSFRRSLRRHHASIIALSKGPTNTHASSR